MAICHPPILIPIVCPPRSIWLSWSALYCKIVSFQSLDFKPMPVWVLLVLIELNCIILQHCSIPSSSFMLMPPVLESAEAWRQRLQAPSSFPGSETILARYFCSISLIPETVFFSIHAESIDIVKICSESKPLTKEAGFGTFPKPQEPANPLGVCKSMFLSSTRLRQWAWAYLQLRMYGVSFRLLWT